MINEQIIKSLLDTDMYTLTVGQVAFKDFPEAIVEYTFIDRHQTIYPKEFVEELRNQLEMMRNIWLTDAEYTWLDNLGYFSYDYLQFLKNYRFDPSEVTIAQINGRLHVEFRGIWERLIMWEVPFLALVSELKYKMTAMVKHNDWRTKIGKKADMLQFANCLWMDFGTRRRFDFDTQDEVVSTMKHYPGFIGTSNMYLAFVHNIAPRGTMSHQGPMAMMAKYGIVNANRQWMNHWRNCYKDKLLTFLPDTFTTDVFLRDFPVEDAAVWNLRQDSGSPYVWMDKVLAHYAKLGLPTDKHTFVFSDSLNAENFIALTNRYRQYGNIVGGIGTNFSNDCGHPALNIVIKLTAADFGNGMIPVVKLSDANGKYTGKPEAILHAKNELGLV